MYALLIRLFIMNNPFLAMRNKQGGSYGRSRLLAYKNLALSFKSRVAFILILVFGCYFLHLTIKKEIAGKTMRWI